MSFVPEICYWSVMSVNHLSSIQWRASNRQCSGQFVDMKSHSCNEPYWHVELGQLVVNDGV